jgi:hypothetical protein
MKDLFVVIAYIVIIALIVVGAYFISISDLPDWFKFFLLH